MGVSVNSCVGMNVSMSKGMCYECECVQLV